MVSVTRPLPRQHASLRAGGGPGSVCGGTGCLSRPGDEEVHPRDRRATPPRQVLPSHEAGGRRSRSRRQGHQQRQLGYLRNRQNRNHVRDVATDSDSVTAPAAVVSRGLPPGAVWVSSPSSCHHLKAEAEAAVPNCRPSHRLCLRPGLYLRRVWQARVCSQTSRRRPLRDQLRVSFGYVPRGVLSGG